MPSPAYFLSDRDRQLLGSLINDYKARQGNQSGRSTRSIEYEESLAPEVYIARSPAEGIPALSESTTGTGTGTIPDDLVGKDCDIYRIDYDAGGPDLEPAGFSELVYNLTTTPIPPNAFVLIVREKFGCWFVASGQGGGASDHFPARIAVNKGLGNYTVVERYPPRTDLPGGRVVTAIEVNGNGTIEPGINVLVFVYTVGTDTDYYFDYCCVLDIGTGTIHTGTGTSTIQTGTGTGTSTAPFFVSGTTLCGGVAIPNTLYMTITSPVVGSTGDSPCPECSDLVVRIFNVTGSNVWSTLNARINCCGCEETGFNECSFRPMLAFYCDAHASSGTDTDAIPATVTGVTPSNLTSKNGKGTVDTFVEFFFYGLEYGMGKIDIVVTE